MLTVFLHEMKGRVNRQVPCSVTVGFEKVNVIQNDGEHKHNMYTDFTVFVWAIIRKGSKASC